MNRRELLLSSLAMVSAPRFARSDDRSGDGQRPLTLGFNLITWDDLTNTDKAAWVNAVKAVHKLGVRHVTLVPYVLVDREAGRLIAASQHGIASGVSLDIVAATMRAARSLSMSVALKPMIEIDNDSGPGDIWRGLLRLDGEKLEAFFQSYAAFVLKLARLARGGAKRLYVGSELGGLTGNSEAHPYWLQLIGHCRSALAGTRCLLTYAANFDEYYNVPFWGLLDEIGIDAYFPLATAREAGEIGAPSVELLTRNWQGHLAALHAFAERQGKTVHFSEWGVVPFNRTTVQPSDEDPSRTPDPVEALHAYTATLAATSMAGSWLRGIDFWHWSMSDAEESNYRIRADGQIADIIRTFTAKFAQGKVARPPLR